MDNKEPLDTFGLDMSGVIPGSTHSTQTEDALDTWKKDRPFRPYSHEWGIDWTGDEYGRHLKQVHNKYPLLTQLLLHGGPDQNANLSTHEDTDKYARLADAYNAKYRYVAPKASLGSGVGRVGSLSTQDLAGTYENVAHLDTQDQKQMDQLRQAQADLRGYNLDTEKHYQQAYLKQKMDEAMKLTNQGYEESFFMANHEMERTRELFNMFGRMSEEQYKAVMDKYRMPAAISSRVRWMIQNGHMFEAMLLAEKNGLTPQSVDQVLFGIQGERIVKGLVDGTLSYEAAQAEIGKLKGQALLGQLTGLYNAAMENQGSLSPQVKQAASTLKTALDKANAGAAWAIDHAGLIAAGGALLWALAQVAPFIAAAATKGATAKNP